MLLSKEKMPLMKLVLAILFIFFQIGYSSYKGGIFEQNSEFLLFCWLAQPELAKMG